MSIRRFVFPAITLSILISFLFCFAQISFSEGGRESKIYAEETPGLVQNQDEEDKPIVIRLGRAPFDPLRSSPVQQGEIKQLQAYEHEEIDYYVVQFDGPIQRTWKEGLKGAGADVFDYIPDFAFIIRLNSKDEQIVRNLLHVRWLGIYQPSYRIRQGSLDTTRKTLTGGEESQGGETPSALLRVSVFPGEDLDRI